MSTPPAPPRRYRIRGHSMYPALRDGDVVSIDAGAYAKSCPQVGDVVLARHPFKAGVQMVKRVAEVTEDGRLVLLGDDPRESEDSRGFGPVRADSVLGRVVDA